MESKSEENYNPEEYLLNTLNNLDIGFVKINNAGVILNHNLTYNKIFGYNPEKNLIGTKILDYWQNTDDRDNFRKILYKNDIVKKYITSAKNLDGKQIFLELNFKLEKNSNGEIISSEGIFVDITERTETEQNLKESEIKSQNIIENLPMGVHIYQLRKDGHLYFIGANPAADQILGVDNSLYIGKTIDQAFPNIVDTDIPEKFSEIAEKGGFWYKEDIIYEDKRIKGAFENFNFQSSPGIVVSLFNDISERKKAEQKLSESEEKWRAITKYTPDHIWVIDTNYKLTFVNYTVPDLSVDEVIGNHYSNFVQKEYLEQHEEILKEVMETGKTILWETGYLDNYGKQLYFDVHSGPIFKEGKVIGIVTRSTDITERKETELKLKESEEKLKKFMESATDGFSLLDSKLNFIDVNKVGLQIVGMTKEDLIGKNILDITPNLKETGRYDKYLDVLKTGEPFSTEDAIFNRLDGSLTSYFSLRVFKVGDDLGMIHTDITERKKKEDELRLHSEMMKNMNEGINLIRASDLIIVYANPRFEEMFGYNTGEIIGKHASIINAPTDKSPEEMAEEIMAILDNSGEWHGEIKNIKKDRSSLWCYANISFFNHPEYGKVFVSILTDITERKKKEKEIIDLARFPSEDPYPILRISRNKVMYINQAGQKLLNVVESDQIPEIFQESVKNSFESNQISESEVELDSRTYSFIITPVKDADYVNIYGMDITERKHVEEKLREVNKLKSEFLRRASHELKTPLISIKGFSELILSLHEDQLETPIISKLREINDGCERLQNIINDLLKTSRLESPDLKPNVQKEDLSFLINFCVHELQALAERRKQSIKLDIHSKLFANIEKEEIHDVLSNLLTNAIKYTPPNGKIEVTTELKEDSVVVSVSDNGIGFTEEQKKMIFQQFGKIERYGKGLDLGIDGTGLGLYISKRIVEAHDGKIWMESEGKNKGSTFYFTLPTVK